MRLKPQSGDSYLDAEILYISPGHRDFLMPLTESLLSVADRDRKAVVLLLEICNVMVIQVIMCNVQPQVISGGGKGWGDISSYKVM